MQVHAVFLLLMLLLITFDGRYFVWVKLPDGLTGDHLLQIAVPEYRVKVRQFDALQ